MNTQVLLNLTLPSYDELCEIADSIDIELAAEQINMAEMMGGK